MPSLTEHRRLSAVGRDLRRTVYNFVGETVTRPACGIVERIDLLYLITLCINGWTSTTNVADERPFKFVAILIVLPVHDLLGVKRAQVRVSQTLIILVRACDDIEPLA